MRKRIGNLRSEDGQALVELALVVPLLLFILFAIIDFGLAINQYNDATNLANIGARAAAVASTNASWTAPTCPGGVTSTSLSNYMQCSGAQNNGALGAAAVCAKDLTAASNSWTNAAVGDTIVIKVGSAFNWLGVLTGGLGKIGGLTLQTALTSSATMRLESAPVPPWVSTTPTTATVTSATATTTVSC